jgi:hypothetical protein
MISSAYLRATLVAAVAMVTLALGPAVAFADQCDPELFDSVGNSWDLNSDGTISDGSEDAYDTYGHLTVEPSGGSEEDYDSAATDACTHEEGGREVAYPVQTSGFGGLEVSRKVFVPDSGLAFARTLDIVSNPTGAAITATIRREGNLGTDSDTEIVETSSGDDVITPDDAWAVIDEDDFEDTMPNIFWDSDAPGVQDRADDLSNGPFDTADNVEIVYQDVTIEPGAIVIYMHVDNQTENRPDGVDFAHANGGGPDEFYAGLSSDERSRLRNWLENGDQDRDGIQNPSDNCKATPNPDQADNEGDGQGDPCDPDDDNDGVSDAAETELGLNPRSADTDGDGKSDKDDACPKAAGSGADGCPVAERIVEQQQPQQRDTTKPNLVVELNGDGLPVDLNVTCDEACSVRGALYGSTSAANVRVAGFNLALARRRLPLGTGTRRVRLRPCSGSSRRARACRRRIARRLRGGGKLRLKLVVTAADAAGNRTRNSRRITVE